MDNKDNFYKWLTCLVKIVIFLIISFLSIPLILVFLYGFRSAF